MKLFLWIVLLVPSFLFTAFLESAYGSFKIQSWNPDQYLSQMMSAKNRVIRVIQYTNSREMPQVIQQKFDLLKDKPLDYNLILEIIHWFHDSLGDSRIEIFVKESDGAIALTVHFQNRQKITALQFDGPKIFSAANLQTLVELKEGMDLDPVALDNSINKILSFYNSQGYFKTTIRPVYDKQILHFIIDEGAPTTIRNIAITPITAIENKVLKKRLEEDVLDYFVLLPGDRLERERLDQGLLNIKIWLRGHDFLVAKDPIIETTKNFDGSVDIRLNINYGSRIRFGFRGNNLFSYRELLALVGDVKEVSSGTDYLEAVRRKVIDAYKEAGFVNIVVNTLIHDDPDKGIKNVSLVIDEGHKVRISRINVEGIYSLPSEEAKSILLSFSSRLNQRGFFQESGINKAAELLADHLRARGYLSAKLEFTKYDFSSDKKEVAISLLYNEGVQTKIGSVEIVGAKNLPEEEILNLLALRSGEPLDIFAFEKGLNSLKEKYLNMGHLAMKITNEGTESIVRYSADQLLANIKIEIDEGPLMHAGEIIVRGNSLTHAKVILRELPFIEKDILTASLLKESEDNLRKLNLFSSVIVRPIEHPGEDSIRDILVLVEETTPGSFEVAPGFRNDLGFRLGIGAGYQNIGGWHRGASASFAVNRRVEKAKKDRPHFLEYDNRISFREPYFANWPVTLTTSLNVLKREFTSFDADISKISASFRREISRYVTGILEYSYERDKFENVDTKVFSASDAGVRYIGAITPGIIFDSRNDKFNPANGILSNNRIEVASDFLGSQSTIGYYRAITDNSAYLKVFDDTVLALAVNFGYERSNLHNQAIPPLKLFRLGGIGSVRGYTIDAIQVESAAAGKNIMGTLAMYNYRAELRTPLSGSLGGALFYDAGNLSVDKVTPFALRSAVGAGLRYNTPVGPVALDFAWKLENESAVGDTFVQDDSRYRITFSIGSF